MTLGGNNALAPTRAKQQASRGLQSLESSVGVTVLSSQCDSHGSRSNPEMCRTPPCAACASCNRLISNCQRGCYRNLWIIRGLMTDLGVSGCTLCSLSVTAVRSEHRLGCDVRRRHRGGLRTRQREGDACRIGELGTVVWNVDAVCLMSALCG